MGLLKERLQPPKQSGTAAKDNATLDLSNFPTRMEQFEFEGRLIYCFNSGGLAPSWCLNDHEMIVGFSPQAVKAYLTRGNRYEPMSRDPRLAGLLSGAHAPTALIYWDPQGICRFCYSCLTWCARRLRTVSAGRVWTLTFRCFLPCRRSIVTWCGA